MDNFSRDMTLREYWKQRMLEHGHDRYRGRALVKMPEDLRTYEQIIEATKPDTIVELGTYAGGSALWFRDRLRLFSGPDIRVVTVDLFRPKGFYRQENITFIEADLISAATRERVKNLVAGRRVMVVEDSAHSYDITTKALQGYADLVSAGCYIVVEDGVVDEPDLTVWNDVGVQPAIADFLASQQGLRFEQRFLEPFGLTMHFGGWLYAREEA